MRGTQPRPESTKVPNPGERSHAADANVKKAIRRRTAALLMAVDWLAGSGRTVSDSAARILIALASHADDSKPPKREILATTANSTLRSVSRALAELLAHPEPIIARRFRRRGPPSWKFLRPGLTTQDLPEMATLEGSQALPSVATLGTDQALPPSATLNRPRVARNGNPLDEQIESTAPRTTEPASPGASRSSLPPPAARDTVRTEPEAAPGVLPFPRSGDGAVGGVETRTRTRRHPPRALVDVAKTARVVPWSAQACEDWSAAFGGTAPGGRIGKALKPLVDRDGWETVRRAWRAYLLEARSEGPKYATPQTFAEREYGRLKHGPSRPAMRGKNQQVVEDFLARKRQEGADVATDSSTMPPVDWAAKGGR